MTTPRVTVPVEPTEAMIEAGNRALSPWIAPAMHAAEAYRAMLSAAPAPEGGAVDVESGIARTAIVNVVERYVTGWGGQFADNPYDAAPHLARELLAALATREEAPAEAGERPFFPSGENGLIGFSLKAARVLRTMLNARDLKEGVAVADELIADLEAALRAQPPAREDAQPVAWMRLLAGQVTDLTCIEREGYLPLYFHPAPDALRVAVEALGTTRDRIQTWPIDDHETCMCGSTIEAHDIGSGHSPVSQADYAISKIVEEIDQALAARQAEQKGGDA